jgi:hypothetical protein
LPQKSKRPHLYEGVRYRMMVKAQESLKSTMENIIWGCSLGYVWLILLSVGPLISRGMMRFCGVRS